MTSRILPRFVRFATALLVALFVGTAVAADAVYTIVEGEARVLRGTTWFRLAAGAHAQDGDIVLASERAAVQLEMPDARKLSIKGPASLLAISVAAGGDKNRSPADLVIQHGWIKAVGTSDPSLRLELPAMLAELTGAAVVDAGAGGVRMFVESGSAKVSTAAVRKKAGPAQDVVSGQFVTRKGSDAPVVSPRPESAFVASMPREYRDALPSLASRFPRDIELAPQGELTLAEAEPWLAGANRRMFVKRFAPRLSDPTFRASVIARAAAFPEWDRIVRPERYRPRDNGGGE